MLTITIRYEDGEYQVPGPKGKEADTYYTTDKDDAISTAKVMWHKQLQLADLGATIQVKIKRGHKQYQ